MKKARLKWTQYLNKRTRASALFLAIIVSFIITVTLSAIFLLAIYQRQYASDNLKVKKLVHRIDEGITCVLQNYDQFDYKKSYEIDLFGDQTDSITFIKQYWGWYDRASIYASDITDSLQKTITIGVASLPKNMRIALFVANRAEHININNDSYIKGALVLPFKGYKSKAGLGLPILPHLPATASTSQLPPIREDRLKEFSVILRKLQTDKNSVQAFLNVNKSIAAENNIDCSNQQIPSEIKNPTILYSSQTIVINQNNVLKNVIIYAPSVVIQSGFKGDLQVFCSDSILVEDNCTLNYPSTLTLIKQMNNSLKSIKVGQHCIVNGAIIAVDEAVGFERCFMRIGEQSVIRGTIYSSGMLENHAKIYGTIYANEITDGTLVNDAGTIWVDAQGISGVYGEPILFLSSKKYEFIK
jgi:hypothetical protein